MHAQLSIDSSCWEGRKRWEIFYQKGQQTQLENAIFLFPEGFTWKPWSRMSCKRGDYSRWAPYKPMVNQGSSWWTGWCSVPDKGTALTLTCKSLSGVTSGHGLVLARACTLGWGIRSGLYLPLSDMNPRFIWKCYGGREAVTCERSCFSDPANKACECTATKVLTITANVYSACFVLGLSVLYKLTHLTPIATEVNSCLFHGFPLRIEGNSALVSRWALWLLWPRDHGESMFYASYELSFGTCSQMVIQGEARHHVRSSTTPLVKWQGEAWDSMAGRGASWAEP